jgi:peptide/nickel transport system ATP-binding protein
VTLLFITHDLAIARYLCDRIAVMYLGDIVEIGPVEEVIGNPRHPYTRILLASVPDPNRARRRERVIVEGEPPNPIARPGGCPFHPRCPDAVSACRATVPTLRPQSATASVACLLYEGAGTV